MKTNWNIYLLPICIILDELTTTNSSTNEHSESSETGEHTSTTTHLHPGGHLLPPETTNPSTTNSAPSDTPSTDSTSTDIQSTDESPSSTENQSTSATSATDTQSEPSETGGEFLIYVYWCSSNPMILIFIIPKTWTSYNILHYLLFSEIWIWNSTSWTTMIFSYND